MTNKSPALIILLVIAAALSVAWALQYMARDTAASYEVTVAMDGRELNSFTLAELESLGTVTVRMQGDTETGPRVLDVLRAAGVVDFSSATFVGTAERDAGRVTLSRSQIDDQVLLDVAKRGTVKVCGPRIERDDRVRDVVRVEVKR